MKRVTTHEAKTHLSRLLAEVRDGEEIVIYRGDQPSARLVAVESDEPRSERRPAVGTVTSAPVRLSADAFAAQTDEELGEWGL